MRMLSIGVRASDTAYGLISALADFNAEAVEQASGEFVVRVDLSDGRTDIAAALTAIQGYVTAHQHDAPAMIDLDGRTYLMDSAH